MASRFPLLASLTLLLILPACAAHDQKVTPVEVFNVFSEEYNIAGLRLFGGMNRNVTGLDLCVINFVDVSCADMTGMQISPLPSSCGGSMVGAQLGLVAVADGDCTGLQFGLLAAVKGGDPIPDGGAVRGAQLSVLVSSSHGTMQGIQFAGALASARKTASGTQLALGGTRADEGMNGLQVSFFANSTRRQLSGAQVALMFNNVSNTVDQPHMEIHEPGPARARGVQIALINNADELHGVQIGLVNFSHNGGLRFCPLINCSLFSRPNRIIESSASSPAR